MSLKEVPAPHHQGKVGLKRKLTGPSQLLFGKCKSRHKPRNSSPKDKTLNSSKRGSSNLMPNNSYCIVIQEETPQEPPGSTPNSLSRLECTSEPWFHSLKLDRDSDSKESKTQESSCLKGWRNFFCHLFLCPRRLKFKPALSNEDLNHGFTYYNQQTRDSVDIAVRPIYQVIEQDVTAAEMEYRHCTKTQQPFLKGILYLRKKKLFSSKSNLKGLDTTLVIQEAAACPCLRLKKQLRHQMRSRAKKPSPFFQERIGSAQEYIHEETIVLSNRHTDEGADGIYQSNPDDSSLQVSVDVTPVMSECEPRTCTLHATHAKSFGETSLLGDQEGAEYAVFPKEEEILTTETIGTDGSNASLDIALCHEHEDENEAEDRVNLTAVNAPENLLICESATSQVNLEDKTVMQKWESTVTEDGQATSHLRPTGNSNCEEMVMDIVNELSRPDVYHGKHRLEIIQSEEAEPAGDGLQCKINDPQPPEMLLYQTARLLVQAAMEAALRQLEEDLVNSLTEYYEETGDY